MEKGWEVHRIIYRPINFTGNGRATSERYLAQPPGKSQHWDLRASGACEETVRDYPKYLEDINNYAISAQK